MVLVRDPNIKSIDELRRWLQPTEYLSPGNEYMKHLKSYTPGTGDWLRESEVFRSWEDDANKGCLWVRGIAGSGKSVFAAATVKTLTETQDGEGLKLPVLFFFFRQIVEKNHDAKYLIRDWISQLLPFSSDLQEKVNGLSAESIDGVESGKLWDALVGCMQQQKKIYCVADALDEMDDQHSSFINQLKELGALKPESIKVMLTSRPTTSIENQLRHRGVESVRLEPGDIFPDILTYVSTRLASLRPRLSRDKETQVREAVCELSEGLFLYARLLMDSIADGLQEGSITPEQLPTAIAQLPRNLTELYTRLLSEHARRSKMTMEQQLVILQCITQSSRPMRLIELGSIVAFLLKDAGVGLMEGKEAVKQACGRFLELLDDETISVIHHSFTEFARDRTRSTEIAGFPTLCEKTAHEKLLELCLQYLDSCEQAFLSFDSPIASKDNKETPDSDSYSDEYSRPCDRRNIEARKEGVRLRRMQDLHSQHPFMAYAAENLGYHMEHLGSTTKFGLLDQYFVPTKTAFQMWMLTHWHWDSKVDSQPLHFAASLGLTQYAQHLLASGNEADAQNAGGVTPLILASEKGHLAIASLLLSYGANPDHEVMSGYKPMHLAVNNNQTDIVRLLLKAGVSCKTERTKCLPELIEEQVDTGIGETPLQYACQRGNIQILDLFIPYMNEDDACKGLRWAVEFRRPDAAEAIIKAGKAPIDTLVDGKSSLIVAAGMMHDSLVEVLLRNGADPNLRAEKRDWDGTLCAQGERTPGTEFLDGTTAIHALAREKGDLTRGADGIQIERCLKLLVEAGSDVNSRTVGNHTPLHYAVKKRTLMFGWGSDKMEYIITDLLLQHDADPNLRCGSGATPLHKVDPELPEIIDLLVRYGADVNAKDNGGASPILSIITAISRDWSTSFSSASKASKEASVLKLIEHGADVTIEDENGWTLLHHMFSGIKNFGNEKLWKAIIEAGADLNKPNRNGKPPLLSMNGGRDGPNNEHLLKLLVGEGLNLASTDASDNNILFGLFDTHDVKWESFEKLLGLGCSVKVRDTNGGTLLHRCIQSDRSVDIFEGLVNAGADPRAVDNDGNTLFHELALSHPGAVASPSKILMLLEMGVDIHSRNKAGRTALHIAFATENTDAHGDYRGERFVDWLLNKKLYPLLDIDAVDNIGASPIHYAASFCETHVGRLIKAGADPTMKTNEGLTPLHIAARGRQSGLIAVLLWAYRNRGVLDQILDASDHSGRTALHYACRSGRPESVRFLIEAGASFSIRDKVGLTPVHSVAEDEEEILIWATKHQGDLPKGFHAACVTLGDLARPGSLNQFSSASIAVRSQDTVHILEAAGADFNATVEIGGEELTLMDLAVAGNCVELVNELRKRGLSAKNVAAEALIPKSGGMKEAKEILGKAEPTRRGSRQSVNDSHETKTGHAKKFADILQKRDYNLFEEFVKIGGDLTAPGEWTQASGLHELVKWGHATLLEKYSVEIASLEEIEWEEGEADPGSLLCHACEQPLPRLEIIKVLVETLKVDVNHISNRYGYTYKGSKATALHWLSTGAHFWNIEAINYLLDHGADIEARNARHETPLMTAVSSDWPDGFWKEETIRILLGRGANPNVLDSDGMSCLNMVDHANVIRLLLNYGADINVGAPATHTLNLANLDLDSVELLLKAGADPNKGFLLHVARPSSKACGTYEAALIVQKQRAMISLLLEYDTDPFVVLSEGSTVLQEIIEDHGILDLFWDIPEFPVELRGSGGRTPLISACFPSITPAPRDWSIRIHTPKLVCYPTAASKLLAMGANAGTADDVARTALHWMCTLSEELDATHQALFADLVDRSPQCIHQQDYEGFTPLHIAFSNSHTHKWITDVLISHGCDPTKADPRGNTVLHYLAPQLLGEKEQALAAAERFRHFLSQDVPINHRNNLGETAVFLFIAKSWKPTTGWSNNRSISNYASDNDITHLKALPIFTDAGVDLQVCNNQGRNLLHVTAERWRKKKSWSVEREQQQDMIEIFKELMDRGLDPRAEDEQCRTAIDVAVTCGKKFLVDLFGPKERGMQRLVVDDTADEDSEESEEE